MIRLRLPRRYTVSVHRVTPYRLHVTVADRAGTEWVEPFDPLRGDVSELESRFRNRIEQSEYPGKKLVKSLREGVAAECLSARLADVGSDLMLSVIRTCAYNVVNDMKNRIQSKMDLEAVGKPLDGVTPEQVIIERATTEGFDGLVKALRPVIDQLVDEVYQARRWRRWRRATDA